MEMNGPKYNFLDKRQQDNEQDLFHWNVNKVFP